MDRTIVIGSIIAGLALAILTVLVLFGEFGLLGVFMGLVVHAFKALMTAKMATGDASGLNPVTYFTKYWVEAGTALVCAFGLWFALPEMVGAFGEYTKGFGITKETVHGYLPGFMCGMFGDQIADFLGGRIKKLYAGTDQKKD